jgi:hypothetical protein
MSKKTPITCELGSRQGDTSNRRKYGVVGTRTLHGVRLCAILNGNEVLALVQFDDTVPGSETLYRLILGQREGTFQFFRTSHRDSPRHDAIRAIRFLTIGRSMRST